jgi:cytidylate kinase
MRVTIDGPSVSGKSTVARAVAKELHYFYIASGYIYRGLAYALMHLSDYTQDTIGQVQESDIAFCLNVSRFAYHYDAVHAERIICNGVDITTHLKTPAIDTATSVLATNELVRMQVLHYIRALANHHDIVIDGRDCGSVVFPQAEYKFYLTASLPARALRWQAMQASVGKHVSLDESKARIFERDERDSARAAAPLKIPSGAYVIDSSDLTAEDVIALIVSRVCEQKKEEA